ncbi:MAG: exosortase family protein XrtF [Weeksellaceae bacterium]|nr:exosortase family protein XrtF [Weeksellaceae bacterium]
MLKEYKPILIFLLKFVFFGVLLMILYNVYLNQYHKFNLPDPYSIFIADCTVSALNTAGFEAKTHIDKSNPWVWIKMGNQWPSYINEGCNAISIMIVFVAFVLAFSKGWLKTTLFILISLFIIQLMNVFRIGLLNWIFIYHNEYGKMAHDYLFPAIIYGTIVVLWVVWVKYVAQKTEKKKENEVA